MGLSGAEIDELHGLAKEALPNLSEDEQKELTGLINEIAPMKVEQQEVIDASHPELGGMKGFGVRALYKNLGEQGLGYLEKQYPNLQWNVIDGEPVVRTPGEGNKWYKLDPSTLEASDITDIAYDIPAGAAQGAATAAAGLAGGAATLPAGGIGAIPAAMAASGALGAGMETIRQYLGTGVQEAGEALGLDITKGLRSKPGISEPGHVALAGGIGAILPGGIGTGAAKGQIAKMALKRGLSEEALKKSQSGILRKKVAPFLGSKFGTKPRALIDAAKEKLSTIIEPDGALAEVPAKVQQLQSTVTEAVRGARKIFGEKIGAMHKAASEQIGSFSPEGAKIIRTQEIIAPLTKLKEELQTLAKTPENEATIKEIDGVINSIFTVAKEGEEDVAPEMFKKVDKMLGLEEAPKIEYELPESITIEDAWNSYHQLKGKAQGFGGNLEKSGTMQGTVGKAPTVVDDRIAGAAHEARENIKQAMEQKIGQAAEEEALYELNSTVANAIRNKNSPAYQGDPSIVKSMLLFDEPGTEGMTLAQKEMAYVKKRAQQKIEEYRVLNSQFSDVAKLASEFQASTKDPAKMYSLLQRAQKNPVLAARLQDLSKRSGIDLKKETVAIKAMETFGAKTPQQEAMETVTPFTHAMRATAGGAISGALGGLAAFGTGIPISPYFVGMATGTLGGLATYPPALRRYMQMGRFGAETIMPGIQTPVGQMRYTPWLMKDLAEQQTFPKKKESSYKKEEKK